MNNPKLSLTKARLAIVCCQYPINRFHEVDLAAVVHGLVSWETVYAFLEHKRIYFRISKLTVDSVLSVCLRASIPPREKDTNYS